MIKGEERLARRDVSGRMRRLKAIGASNRGLAPAVALGWLMAVASAQAEPVPRKPPQASSVQIGERRAPTAVRTWAAGERISDLDLALFDDNGDRLLDRNDDIYRRQVVVRRRGSERPMGGVPRVRLTPRGPVAMTWAGARPVTLWARVRFGVVTAR